MRNYCFMPLPEILSTFADDLRERVTALASELGSELARGERALSERFNQTARRLRLAETQAEWRTILVEAAAGFCAKAEVFLSRPGAHGGGLRRSPRVEGNGGDSARRGPTFPCRYRVSWSGAQFALLSVPDFRREGGDGDSLRGGSEGLLDRNALELLAVLAAGSLPEASPDAGTADAESRAAARMALQAQRFARVRVAKMVLSSRRKLERGRQDGNLYVIFKEDIDLGRLEFRRQFMDFCPSMADYFHQELVHTLAKDDAKALGSEYPGASR